MAELAINNHLSFMMSLLHVLVSTRPSSVWLCAKEYNYSSVHARDKFVELLLCQVGFSNSFIICVICFIL